MAVLRVVNAFAYTEKNGVQRVMRPGDLVDSKDPAVKGRPEDWFEDVEVTAERTTFRKESAPIEQATKAPGEKRTTTKTSEKAEPAS